MSTEPSNAVTPQDLSAYFDEELTPEQAEAVALALAQSPELRDEHAQLGLLGGALRATLEAEDQAVPSARFEHVRTRVEHRRELATTRFVTGAPRARDGDRR